MARVAVNALVALVLPLYLTHHLPVSTYGVWALILQLAALVSFLDVGVQTGIAKFVAEFDARGDSASAGKYASAGLAIMSIAAVTGCALSLLLAWKVPSLFHEMPAFLYRDVRISLLLVATSLSFGLVCSVFSAVFIGLQRYATPIAIAVTSRAVYAVAVCLSVSLQGGLIAMAGSVALINIATGLLQVILCRTQLSHIRLRFSDVNRHAARQMLFYCLVLAVWSAAMLCISGLDVAIVGRYDFAQTAFYAVATLPANLIMVILSAALGPLMPAASALSTQRSAHEMGNLLFRVSRYCTIVLFLIGLPLIVFGYPLLHLWVGPLYALHSLRFLQVLVVATIVRNLCLPFATMVVALGKQRVATVSALAEAVANLGSSLYLAQRYGAIGVAAGTLLGALVSILLHFGVSMHYTQTAMQLTRSRLFIRSVLRSSSITFPSLILAPLWWPKQAVGLTPPAAIGWAISTGAIAWFWTLDPIERSRIVVTVQDRIGMLHLS